PGPPLFPPSTSLLGCRPSGSRRASTALTVSARSLASVVDLEPQSGVRTGCGLASLYAQPCVRTHAQPCALAAHHGDAAVGLIESVRHAALRVHAAHHRAQLEPEARGDLPPAHAVLVHGHELLRGCPGGGV